MPRHELYYYLEITSRVPSVFHNQQFGKRHGFRVEVALKNAGDNTTVKGRKCTLKASLVYADNQEDVPVEDKKKKKGEVLKLLDWSDIDASGAGFLFCRINDVSRNHQGRSFRLRIIEGTARSSGIQVEG